MTRRLISLLPHNRGAVTIELALATPLLAAMLVGMVDLSTAYSTKLRLEQVAQRTIEKVQQKEFTIAMKTTLEAEAKAAAGAGSNATLTYLLECDGVQTTYTSTCTTGQSYARFVQMDVEKTFTPILLKRFAESNADGTYSLHGVAGIRIQ